MTEIRSCFLEAVDATALLLAEPALVEQYEGPSVLEVAPPPLPPAATGLAIAALVEVARIRHGDPAVLRALTRRERDAVDALRVL